MELVIGVLSVVALIGVGVSVTLWIGSRVPEQVFERAQAHGRFSGLSASTPVGGGRGAPHSRRVAAAPGTRPAPALRGALERTS